MSPAAVWREACRQSPSAARVARSRAEDEGESGMDVYVRALELLAERRAGITA